MRDWIKKHIPTEVVILLKKILGYKNLFWQYFYIKRNSLKQKGTLIRLNRKSHFTVLFVAISPASWKYASLYRALEKDENFTPYIVVADATYMPQNEVESNRLTCINFFQSQGFRLIFPGKKEFIKVEERDPDIVFFSTPYNHVSEEFQITSFSDSLCCYCQYSFVIERQLKFYDSLFQNLLWKYYCETETHRKMAARIARTAGKNVFVSGYPTADIIKKRTADDAAHPVFRAAAGRKVVVWAPHWTIKSRIGIEGVRPPFTSFLEHSEYFFDIVNKHREDIYFVLKPHPELIRQLRLVWGEKKAEDYYVRWRDLPNGRLELGSYVELFRISDAMIFDSRSFLSEYLYTKKPALYTPYSFGSIDWMNEFGQLAAPVHYMGWCREDIEHFLSNVVLGGDDWRRSYRERFVNTFMEFSDDKTVAERIVSDLRSSLIPPRDDGATNRA